MLVQFQIYNPDFGTKYPRISKQELKECIHAGYTHKKIAEKYGVTMEVVGRSLNWYGLKSARTLERERNRANVINLSDQGYSIKAIRKELGLPTEMIRRIIKKHSEQNTKTDPVLNKIAAKLNLSSEDLKKYLK